MSMGILKIIHEDLHKVIAQNEILIRQNNENHSHLKTILKNQTLIMAKQEKMDAMLTRLDAATNEIASDLAALREEIKDSVSQESLDKLDANISTLEGLGADPADPVPEPIPEEPPQ